MRRTRRIVLGGVPIGGGMPVAVQSMCNTDTRDAGATLGQIRELGDAGCEIVRCAVPDEEAAAEPVQEDKKTTIIQQQTNVIQNGDNNVNVTNNGTINFNF